MTLLWWLSSQVVAEPLITLNIIRWWLSLCHFSKISKKFRVALNEIFILFLNHADFVLNHSVRNDSQPTKFTNQGLFAFCTMSYPKWSRISSGKQKWLASNSGSSDWGRGQKSGLLQASDPGASKFFVLDLGHNECDVNFKACSYTRGGWLAGTNDHRYKGPELPAKTFNPIWSV